MKSKKIVVILIICAVLIVAAAAVVLLSGGTGMSTGVCVRADNGGCLIVLDGSPVSMHQRSGGDMFSGLDTGDRLFIIHDGIAETYPGQTGVYFALKLSDGDRDDVPADVLHDLRQLGWISGEDNGYAAFYDEPTEEFTIPSGSRPVELTAEQSGRLRDIIDSVEHWTDDHLTDRVKFFFDGELHLPADERVYYFCDEYDAIYYEHYFTRLSAEDMDFIMSIDPERG